MIDAQPALLARVPEDTGLVLAWNSLRAALFVDHPGAAVLLEGGEGAFAGNVFARGSTGTAVLAVDRGTAHSILASDSRVVLDRFWGSYVLVTEDAYNGAIRVSRDPSGGMPCFYAVQRALTAFSSDVRTLVAAGVVKPAIAPSALARHLAYRDVLFEETCIQDVHDLRPGMQRTIAGKDQNSSLWWSPSAFCDDVRRGTDRALLDNLRETVDGCVATWCDQAQHVLVSLSGGLDSSILTSASTRSGSSITTFTMLGEDRESDERKYAHVVSSVLGLPLLEGRYRPEDVDLSKSSAPHLPWPVGAAHMQPLNAAAYALAEQTGASLMLNGLGGDNVFCFLQSAIPLADSLRAGRSPFSCWKTLRDICRLADVNFLAVLIQAARLLVKGIRPVAPVETAAFLASDLVPDMLPYSPHPWCENAKAALPGREHHVRMLAHVQPYIYGMDRWKHLISISPLLSQPIIELCLGISSWRQVSGGKNRAVAREAYADRLPAAVLTRRSKGGPGFFSKHLCLENLTVLRETLLEGELARQHLLDRLSVEAALTPSALLKSGAFHEILALAEAEAWATHWLRDTTSASSCAGSASR